ncbi:MAG: polysaccharide pyruvyl transferase family protein [Alphaproteobacteria bacterium]|nr:polysaccharide pyruvyl transferase family protein [Alphaproteobacteria bacterium]
MRDLPFASRDHLVLYGYYGCGNFGDDLLLLATIAGLRPIFPGYGFIIRDHGLAPAIAAAGTGITFTGIETILVGRGRSRAGRWLRYFAAWWRILGQARWLIFGGGTVFHARPSLNSLLLQWVICAMARRRGVHIAALGIGVSELQPAARGILRRIVAMSDLFLVRDAAALAQCAGTRAQLGGELAFGLTALRKPQPGDRNNTVGLTVYPPACTQPAVIETLRQTVRLLRERGSCVIFLVSQRPGVAADDAPVFAEIADKVEVRTLEPNPAALARALDGLGVVCGMRYHAMAIGAMAGIPFAGIAHDNKIAELCRQFAMPCVELPGLTAERLVAAIVAARGRTPDARVLDVAAATAAVNFSLLAKYTASANAKSL